MDLVVLTDLPGVTVSATSRVLKSHEVAAVNDAHELLKRAQTLRTAWADKAHAAHQAAREQGWAQGMAEAQQAMAERLATAHAARLDVLRDMTPALVDIVADAVSTIVHGLPRTAILAQALRTVGGLLQQARWARMRVHPSQTDAAQDALREASAGWSATTCVSVVPDPTLPEDGCVFDTDVGLADASLSIQLDAIRSAIAQAMAPPPVDADNALGPTATHSRQDHQGAPMEAFRPTRAAIP